MPKRPSKDWHDPFVKDLAKTRNVDKAAASVCIKRATAYTHYRQDPAFAAHWDAALKWQTAFLESLSLSGNITLGARSVGLSWRAACGAREQDPEIAAEWDAALWEGVETLEGLRVKYATEGMSERMLKIPTTSARARLGPDPLGTAEGARPMAGAPIAAAELAPPPTYTDASGIERQVSEWEGGEAGAGEWEEGEADAEEVGLRRGAANPTYILHLHTAAGGCPTVKAISFAPCLCRAQGGGSHGRHGAGEPSPWGSELHAEPACQATNPAS